MSQSDTHMEFVQLSPREILLDPNSFRLIDDPCWQPVADEEIANHQVQRTTLHAVLRESRVGVRGLTASIQQHGWLDTETLCARRLPNGSYVTVDGNRRLVAWRELVDSGGQLSLFSDALFSDALTAITIPVQIVPDPASRTASLVLGLRHAMPPSPWGPLGRAIWTERHHAAYGEWPARSFTRPIFGRSRPDREIIALNLTRQFAREYAGVPEKEDVFGLLLEAISNRPVAEWLGINGQKVEFQDRLARLFSWLIPREGSEHGSEADEAEPSFHKPAIGRTNDIRRLAAVLDDPEALAALDAGQRLDELELRQSRLDPAEPEEYLHPWVAAQIARKAPIQTARAQTGLERLRAAIRQSNEEPVESGTDHPWPVLDPGIGVCFKSIELNAFRGLSGVTLSDLRRVNLLVGVNNAGKTSVLEAVYLLSRLADPRGVFETLRVRLRQDPERKPSWLSELLSGLTIDLSAVDGLDRKVTVRMSRPAPSDGVDLSTHIPGLRLDASVAGSSHATVTELFSHRPRRTTQVDGKSVWLSRAILHSPYARLERSAILQAYAESVELQALDGILAAVKEGIDPNIKDVRLVSDTGRFLVEHGNREPMDIASYGEGFQRIFELGILFAAHRGGLVLIDELETAIHPGAMGRFTRMVQELAVRFDVQVFITTHSKETVDAFALNDFRTDDIAAYLLHRTGAGILSRRWGGAELKRAVEVIDLDLRRLG